MNERDVTEGDWKVINPANGSVVETIQLAGVEQVNQAVAAARQAFALWFRWSD